MKFTTLTYNANQPTTQQVNIPTNTDYKVGMKVRRNGEVQQLAPDEFTIYTGEINVIPPEQYTTATKECEDSGSLQMVSLKEADLSAVAGKPIDKDNVWLEFSFDNGTTWEKLIPDYGNVYVNVNDRSSGSNNYIAQLNLKNPGSKWKLQNHGVDTGETADYVVVPETPRIIMTFLGTDFTSITTYPCLWRFIFLYGGQEIPVTIPTDADKTNGYVTFTQAAGDDASFRQLKVAVNVAEVPATVEKEEDTFVNTSGATITGKGVELSVSTYPSLIGKKVTPENIYFNTAAGTGTTPPDLSALEADIVSVWDDNNPAYKLALLPVVTNATTNTILYVAPATGAQNRQTFVNQIGAPADKPFFAVYVNNYLNGWTTEYTLSEGDVITPPKSNVRNNNSRGWVVEVKLDDLAPAWNANFKLNVNEFKSQQGNIAETLADGSSVKVDGTYADGTDFSFDFCTK